MPMPRPRADESRSEFLDRCMGDKIMNEEYPDAAQRYAVCNDLWDRKRSAPPALVRLEVVPEIKAISVEKREVVHVISTARQDRAGDIVEPSGWKVDEYLRNPVVLADHDYRIEKIIGRAVDVRVTEAGLFARTRFHDRGLGAEAFELVKAGMARAWSVGFKPLEYEEIKDKKGRFKGFRFKSQELLEYSLVAVPMNPDALNLALRRGIVSEEGARLLCRVGGGCEQKNGMHYTRRTVAPADMQKVREFVERARRRITALDAIRAIPDLED